MRRASFRETSRRPSLEHLAERVLYTLGDGHFVACRSVVKLYSRMWRTSSSSSSSSSSPSSSSPSSHRHHRQDYDGDEEDEDDDGDDVGDGNEAEEAVLNSNISNDGTCAAWRSRKSAPRCRSYRRCRHIQSNLITYVLI